MLIEILAIVSLVIGLLSLAAAVLIGAHIVRRRQKTDTEKFRLQEELLSVADIYTSMHFVNFESNTFHEISAIPESHDFIKDFKDPQRAIASSMKYFISSEYVDRALEFTDFKLVRERLRGKKVISTDLVSRLHGWLRISFITVNADAEGYPVEAIFAVRSIEEDKKSEEYFKFKATTDELTGFLNRHAYEEDLQTFQRDPGENLVYVSIDVNGLKTVNDNSGHEAGDELLKGAAYCIAEAFSEYGKTYRTGGDEFAVILHADSETLESIQSDFRNLVSGWKGRMVDSLAVSCGYVERNDFEFMDMQELANYADQRMYKDKAIYYAKKGIDRRGQQDVYNALCNSYTKILKANLTDESFNIIQMQESEKNAMQGFCSSVTKWLKDFALAGYVHPDDVDDYLQLTDLDYLRNFFKAGNTRFSQFYRRKNGENWTQVMMEIIPAREYDDRNQFVFMFVKNIEK